MPDEELDKYKTRSYMFGGPWIFMNRLSQMRQEDLALAASEIELYKAIRTRIRDGKVYHLSPRPAEHRIDAIQSYHEATDSAIAFLMRSQASNGAYQLRLRGLKPDSSYKVRFQEDSRVLTMTGEQLMTQGIRVPLPGMWTTEIVYAEAIRE
jgi:alpha-galactosidase